MYMRAKKKKKDPHLRSRRRTASRERPRCEVCGNQRTTKVHCDYHPDREAAGKGAIWVLCDKCTEKGTYMNEDFARHIFDIPQMMKSDKQKSLKELSLRMVAIALFNKASYITAEKCRVLDAAQRRSIMELVVSFARLSSRELENTLLSFKWGEVKEVIDLGSKRVEAEDLVLLETFLPCARVERLQLQLNKLGVQAANVLRRMLEIDTIEACNASWNSFGPQGALAISLGIQNCAILTELSVAACAIGSEGASYLARAMSSNQSIRSLNVAFNDIGYEGAAAFAHFLKRNKTLVYLNMRNNDIGEQGAVSLSDCLRVNETLREIVLVDNHIGKRGAAAIAQFYPGPLKLLKKMLGM